MFVLLIDDDSNILHAAKRLLERGGIDVAVHEGAFNATNAIVRLQPDLVLMDVNMPFLSGDQLFELFGKHRAARHVPVVFFSSTDEQSLRALVRNTGALGYIVKSEMGGDLVSQVRRLHERYRALGSGARN